MHPDGSLSLVGGKKVHGAFSLSPRNSARFTLPNGQAVNQFYIYYFMNRNCFYFQFESLGLAAVLASGT